MPEDIQDSAEKERQGRERRAWQRFLLPVDEENYCGVEGHDGRRACVRVCDISVGGARIVLADRAGADATRAMETLAPGMALRFDGCSLGKWGKHLNGAEAIICWSHDREAGCRFLKVLGENKD